MHPFRAAVEAQDIDGLLALAEAMKARLEAASHSNG